MTLRTKLFLAQAPLAIALLILGIVSFRTARDLGERSQDILKDNYRSVLATQRMKEYAERLDSAALYLITGEDAEGRLQAGKYLPLFEAELKVQEGNITEAGEAEATSRLRSAWNQYAAGWKSFGALPPEKLRGWYFGQLHGDFQKVKDGADAILNINQDAMVAKGEIAQKEAQGVRSLLFGVTTLAFALGLFSSIGLTRRLLVPLSSLTLSARQIGEGDLAARATVKG